MFMPLVPILMKPCILSRQKKYLPNLLNILYTFRGGFLGRATGTVEVALANRIELSANMIADEG